MLHQPRLPFLTLLVDGPCGTLLCVTYSDCVCQHNNYYCLCVTIKLCVCCLAEHSDIIIYVAAFEMPSSTYCNMHSNYVLLGEVRTRPSFIIVVVQQ